MESVNVSILFLDMNGFCKCGFIICVFEWNLWICSLLFINMNRICECFSLHYLFIWMDSVNFLIFNFYLNWICNYFFYLLLIWMESVNFSYHLFIWMESVNVFYIVCLDEWDLWMFSLLFVKMNGLLWLIWLLGIWRHFQQYFNCHCNQC